MKNSRVLWIVLGIAGLCAVCTMMTAMLVALGLIADDTSTTPGRAAPTSVSSSGVLPRGETPDLFPGSPGWLPSGRGVEIPEASADDSGPQGLWWSGSTSTIVFLADGTRASNPRPGGGTLFDLEGQRAQRGATGVGTFRVEDGSITQAYDGFTTTDAYTFGDDGSGPYLDIGGARYRPLRPPTEEELVGQWKAPGGEYVFAADGSCSIGHITAVAVGGGGCRWRLEGYLLEVQPNGARGWLSFIGASSDSLLIIGSSAYSRQ